MRAYRLSVRPHFLNVVFLFVYLLLHFAAAVRVDRLLDYETFGRVHDLSVCIHADDGNRNARFVIIGYLSDVVFLHLFRSESQLCVHVVVCRFGFQVAVEHQRLVLSP